jgi:HD-like signal output (HDOD) protein
MYPGDLLGPDRQARVKERAPTAETSSEMDHVEALIEGIDQFPTLPDVATRALAELESEDCDFEDVASLVSLDPILAGRVLKLANSAFFGTGQRQATVKPAIARLGINEVRNCILTVAVMHAIPELPEPHSAKRFWTLSLSSALVGQKLAKDLDYEEPDRAYMAGLVHLVGEAVLAIQFTERFRTAIAVARQDSIPFVSALAEEFGCDHAAVTARILRDWKFPDAIVRAVRLQFTPAQAKHDALLAGIVAASDGLCRDLGLGLEEPAYEPRGWIAKLPNVFFAALRGSGEGEVGAYLDGITDEVKELIDFALTVF